MFFLRPPKKPSPCFLTTPPKRVRLNRVGGWVVGGGSWVVGRVCLKIKKKRYILAPSVLAPNLS